MATKVEILDYFYDTALSLAKERDNRFTNQFVTNKLKIISKDDHQLNKYIEGTIGYLGDMSAALLFDYDPQEIMRNMIIDTDLLEHRDDCDLIYRGNRIDVKTEFYGKNQQQHLSKLKRILKKKIKDDEAYGCRLINNNQFKQNSRNIDIYLFGTLDNIDPRKAKIWICLGWITTEHVKEISPNPQSHSPAGLKLWTPAHCIPNNILYDFEKIKLIKEGKFSNYHNYDLNPKYKDFSSAQIERFNQICQRAKI